MIGRDVNAWLRALRDCGMMRVRFDDDVLIKGIESGVNVACRPVEGDDDALDVWLTEHGQRLADFRLAGNAVIPRRDPNGKPLFFLPAPQARG